jgi:hypothetical protein
MTGWRELKTGWRGLMTGWRELMTGWRELMTGWRELMTGWRELKIGWRVVLEMCWKCLLSLNDNTCWKIPQGPIVWSCDIHNICQKLAAVWRICRTT